MGGISFPNESPDYRAARDRLLQSEIELRAATEQVAALRRALPVGGDVPEDYIFDRLDAAGQPQAISFPDLFAGGKQSLLLYSFMYGPDMDKPCPMCTSMLDALNGNARQLRERINLAIVAKSPIQRIASFAAARGWTDLPVLSSSGNTYQADYFGESSTGDQLPMANVFVLEDGRPRHFWGSELLYADVEGQPRHVDMLWPLWNALDLTPEGRGTDWYPAL